MATQKTTDGFSAEEKAAMKERAEELKAQAKGSEGEADVLAKMKTRFNTIGFSDSAALDNATMWPTSFAVLEWYTGNEKQLRALVKKAMS